MRLMNYLNGMDDYKRWSDYLESIKKGSDLVPDHQQLPESVTSPEIDEAVVVIQRDCKPFLDQFDNIPLYRGMKDKTGYFVTVVPRTDRRPKDMSFNSHKVLDEAFKEVFGWRARSEGVFCSNSPSTYYGSVYLIYPVGNYRYIYSPFIQDLYDEIGNKLFNEDEAEEFVRQYYRNHGYSSHTTRDTEIMIKCDKYYAVPIEKESYMRRALRLT